MADEAGTIECTFTMKLTLPGGREWCDDWIDGALDALNDEIHKSAMDVTAHDPEHNGIQAVVAVSRIEHSPPSGGGSQG